MSNTITVSTSDELRSALLSAEGGETILLKGGNYGGLWTTAKSGFDGEGYASTVTIVSENRDDPAVFTGMLLKDMKNLTIEDVVFDYTRQADDKYFKRPFQVTDSENIVIKNSVFDGDTKPAGNVEGAEEYGFGYGLSVRKSSDVVIEGNEFQDWIRGLIVDTVDGIVVRGNDVHDIRSDGMNFVRVTDVLVEENYIHDFKANYATGDHRDMIQFWTNGAKTPSTDIVIRNNLLDMGEGSYTQSIFMRNEAVDSQGGGKAMYYQNVVIEGNTIYNGHLHGITVGEADGLTIRDNSLIAVRDDQNPDQSGSLLWVPTINIRRVSTDVVIEGNAVRNINGHEDQSDWSVKSNAFIQNHDKGGVGHYDDTFVTSSMDVGENGHNFVVKSGSMLAEMGVGAVGTKVTSTLENQEVVFDIETGGGNTRVFDASVTVEALAAQGITDVQYFWSFGDGTTAEGPTATHEFTHSGSHDVALTVMADNTVYTADSSVAIRGGQVLSFDGDKGSFIRHSFGNEKTLSKLDAVEDGAIQLGGKGTAAEVWRDNLAGMRGSDAFDIDFTLSGQGSGEVVRFHGTFVSWVNSRGEFGISVYDSDGNKTMVTGHGIPVNDGKQHDISVQLEDQTLQLVVDGTVTQSKTFEGTLSASGHWGLAFGNPWGKANFEGEISSFDISAGPALTPLPEQVFTPEPSFIYKESKVAGTSDSFALYEENPPIEMEGSGFVAQPEADAPVEAAPPAPAVLASPQGVLEDGWSLSEEGNGPLTINNGFENIGRLKEFERSETVAFSVDFNTDDANGAESRLIWNHMKLGLTIKDDEITVQAATEDHGFKQFRTNGLGLTKGEDHKAIVMLDSANDRLQVIVDDTVVIDVDDVDFDHVGAGGREWGWSIGTAWGRNYKGEVADFEVTDRFEFRDEVTLEAQADLDF